MQYFGGKQKIHKEIINILNKYKKENQILMEPFVGGCNIISKMDGIKYCYDINEYLIEMYKAIQNGWIPPKNITNEEYKYIKEHKDENKALSGFVGFGCSYSGKWFGGYAKNNSNRNYCLNAYNSILKQKNKIMDIEFICSDYKKLKPQSSLIYCDPPYKETTQYSITNKFNSEEFWEIMREWSKNNTVIISEYKAPSDFICILEIPTKTSIKDKNGKVSERIEKLFIHKSI